MRNQEPITIEGYNKLKEEIDILKRKERPKIIEELNAARELGDLSENAEYHSAKENLNLIDKSIGEKSELLSNLVIVNPGEYEHNKVAFGSTVQLMDIETEKIVTYTIVGIIESNPTIGLISIHTPMAKQLLGKTIGGDIIINLPNNEYRDYEIKNIYLNKK